MKFLLAGGSAEAQHVPGLMATNRPEGVQATLVNRVGVRQ